jgi:hypothetical protein
MFRIMSNYTEIATAHTLKDAIRLAILETSEYDDAVTIENGGIKIYFAQFGQLYILRVTK